jgi:hypothetical protein
MRNGLQGLETDTPYLQLGPKTYQGHYEYVVGTHLYFEETLREINAIPAADDSPFQKFCPCFDPETVLMQCSIISP